MKGNRHQRGVTTIRCAIRPAIHSVSSTKRAPSIGPSFASSHQTAFRPRLEHVQLLHPDDRGRFGRSGIAASIQPIHVRADAPIARQLWGDRAKTRGYPMRSLLESGAVVAFGTDAPVEPIDPWPGLSMAVTRVDGSWPAGTEPFGPDERLTLEQALRAACLAPALIAAETDRGRLTPGQRADLVVLPATALSHPIEPGGALATARPRLVMIDGEVAFEA